MSRETSADRLAVRGIIGTLVLVLAVMAAISLLLLRWTKKQGWW